MVTAMITCNPRPSGKSLSPPWVVLQQSKSYLRFFYTFWGSWKVCKKAKKCLNLWQINLQIFKKIYLAKMHFRLIGLCFQVNICSLRAKIVPGPFRPIMQRLTLFHYSYSPHCNALHCYAPAFFYWLYSLNIVTISITITITISPGSPKLLVLG